MHNLRAQQYKVYSLIDEAKIRLSNSRLLIAAFFHYFIILINNKHQILSLHLSSESYTYRTNLKFSLFKATSWAASKNVSMGNIQPLGFV